MRLQSQLFSDKRLDEHPDPLPFVVQQQPSKVRRIGVSSQLRARQLAASKDLQRQLHFPDTNPFLYLYLQEFTCPNNALRNQKVVYQLLFQASAETLQEIVADLKHLGAQIGFLSVLHT